MCDSAELQPSRPESGKAVEAVRESVRASGLLAAGGPVLVMVSGGRDSTCLLDNCVSLLEPCQVRALHVNYGLRETADRDEQSCAALCAELHVELIAEPAGVAPANRNFQAWARDRRYELAKHHAAGAPIAVGHTATDQVETVLYRLASSPSRRALLGMRPQEGSLIRPLLGVTRAQTTEYCCERGLLWCDDESNESSRYARNRVRNGLVTALREIHPGAERNVLALAGLLRDEHDVLEQVIDEVLDGQEAIDRSRLVELPPALARLVVQRLADTAIDAPAPGAGRRLDDILALPAVGVAHLDLPHAVRVSSRDGRITFAPTPPFRREPDQAGRN